MAPATFEPVLRLLQRYTIAISAHLHISPADVPALPWWQFEDACDYVDHLIRESRRADG